MARVFNGSNQWLSYTAAAVASPPMTLACWFNVASTTSNYGLITFGGSTDVEGLTARGTSGGVVAAWSLHGSYSDSVSAAYSANTWNHGAAVFSSTSHRQAFLNGSSGAANTDAKSPRVSRTGIGATARTSPSAFCNGSIMWPAIWNVALTDDEIASLAAGAHPTTIRPDALLFFAPLGGFDGDHDIDIVGDLSLTAVNTPTWTDDSPSGLIYPAVPIVGLGTAGGGGGFPSGWSYKRQISIASGQKSGSPTGIVLTITEASGLADANGPLDADGTAPAQNGGGDLRVSSDSAGTNQIPLDAVSFVTDNDHTAATCELKVNFDDLSGDSLYLWWGTAGTESQPAVTDTYGRNAVYSSGNHVLACSMDEDPSGSAPQITDRTGNGNNGTSAGSMTSGDVVAGQLGSAIDFDGNDYIDISSVWNSFPTNDADFSLACWIYTSGSFPHRYINIGDAAAGQIQGFYLLGTAGGLLQGGLLDGSTRWLIGSTSVPTSQWFRATLTYNGTTLQLRLNGADNASTTSGSWVRHASESAMLGNQPGAAAGLVGRLDNVSIYSRALTSADDTTIYNCESNNAAFWSVGSVESVGGGGFGAYLAAASRSSRTLCGSRL